MVVSIPCDMRKDFLILHFFRNEKVSEEKVINFCKFYDSEGSTQLLLRSDHFISPTVGYLVFGLDFMTSIRVMVC